MERVQKFISYAGVASRRKAEEFIKSGQVLINGRKAKLGDKVDPEKDTVKVYGKLVETAKKKLYFAVNKPKGYVVSKSDPKHRKTIFDLLPEEMRSQVWNIGRLDYDTEGLLIMTNDGELTQALAHPKYEHEKEYEVTVQEEVDDSQLEKLRQGVEIATGMTYPAKVKLLNHQANPHPSPSPKGRGKYSGPVVRIIIHEGKKRQVRRMFDAVGLTVSNLKRIRINKLMLPKDLAPGKYLEIKKEDIL